MFDLFLSVLVKSCATISSHFHLNVVLVKLTIRLLAPIRTSIPGLWVGNTDISITSFFFVISLVLFDEINRTFWKLLSIPGVSVILKLWFIGLFMILPEGDIRGFPVRTNPTMIWFEWKIPAVWSLRTLGTRKPLGYHRRLQRTGSVFKPFLCLGQTIGLNNILIGLESTAGCFCKHINSSWWSESSHSMFNTTY